MPGSVRSIVVFLVLFAVLFGLGHLFLGTSIGERIVVRPWVDANIRLALVICAIGGMDASVDGERTMSAPGGAVLVSKGCDGLGALLIVGSAVLGFPAPWQRRLVGVLLGALGVFVINAFRLANLLWISVHWPDRLEFFHIDVWQPMMMAVSFGLFLAWGALLAGGPKKQTGGDGT